MTLLEFAEKTSPAPLTAWQREFLTMYEEAVKEEKELIYFPTPRSGKMMIKDIINKYYGLKLKEIRCKNCNKLLGKIPQDVNFEFVCSKCKTVNKK